MSLRRLLMALALRKARNADAWREWEADARARITKAGGAVTDTPVEYPGKTLCRTFFYCTTLGDNKPMLAMGVCHVGEEVGHLGPKAPLFCDDGDAILAGERRLMHLGGKSERLRTAIRRKLSLAGLERPYEAAPVDVVDVALAMMAAGALQ